MAAKPLVLKRQKPKLSNRAKTYSVSAEVYVTDLPFHLDSTFTYGVPDELLEHAIVGARVKVPLQQSEKIGYIRNLSGKEVHARPILEIKGGSGIPASHLLFLDKVAARYGTNLDAILKFVKDIAITDEGVQSKRFRPRFDFVNDLNLKRLSRDIDLSEGNTLVMAPTQRELDYIKEQLEICAYDKGKCFFGLRGAIMQPYKKLENIVLFDDWSEHYRERKNPFWHARDVAILRAHMEPIKLRFISALPSLELLQYSRKKIIDLGKYNSKGIGRKIRSFPETYHDSIKSKMPNGKVLISVATIDAVLSITCKRCRCALKCSCGGKLRLNQAKRLKCVICMNPHLDWRCSVCSSNEFIELKSGGKNLRDQLRKIFPNVSVYLSTAEKPVTTVNSGSIVIATPGMEPKIKYQAVIFLDAEFRSNAPSLRAEEQTRLQIYSLLGLLEADGTFYIDLEGKHPFVQALLKDKPLIYLERELKEREDLDLPPIWNLTKISNGNLLQLANSLQDSLVKAKFQLLSDEESLIVRTKEDETRKLMDELKILQKYLSLKQQNLLKIEREPADI